MADLEDSTAPTWENVVVGHVNLIDAIDGTITYDASDGKHYELEEDHSDAAACARAAGISTTST